MKCVNPFTETEIDTLHHMHRFHPSRRARMRAHGILLSQQRDTLDAIAQVSHASRRRVSSWIDRWHTRGFVGVYDQPRSGRPPIYSESKSSNTLTRIFSGTRRVFTASSKRWGFGA